LEETRVTGLKPDLQHLTGSSDLVTAYADIRAGFVAQALERNRRATPTVAEARALKAVASRVSTPAQLADLREIQGAMLTAAGVSGKAARHLQAEDRAEAIQGLIRNFLEPAGSDFVEELVYRFLLTRGDALGGSMRNLGGVLAQRKLTRAILAALTLMQVRYHWLDSRSNVWLAATADEPDIEMHLKAMSWSKGRQKRTLVYNIRVPFVRKSVDLCLLACDYPELTPDVLRVSNQYVAFGELKGGIDPAGFDEHWKTARTALQRIRDAFSLEGLSPHTFFVGAGIAEDMANELWHHLEEGTLSNAANLTKSDQLASLCGWLISL